jgi:hypothetical protein
VRASAPEWRQLLTDAQQEAAARAVELNSMLTEGA